MDTVTQVAPSLRCQPPPAFSFYQGVGHLVDKEGFSLNPLSQRKHGANPFIFPTSFRTFLCYLYLPSVIFQVSFSLRFVFFARSHTVFTGSVSSLSPFRPLQFGLHPLVFPEICIRVVPGGGLVDKACDVFSAPHWPSCSSSLLLLSTSLSLSAP